MKNGIFDVSLLWYGSEVIAELSLVTRTEVVPIVVDVVFVFVWPGNAQDDVFVLFCGEARTLRPETGHADHDLHAMRNNVFNISCVVDIVIDGIDHGSISVNFLKGDLPFVMALLSVHGNHGVEGSPVFEA